MNTNFNWRKRQNPLASLKMEGLIGFLRHAFPQATEHHVSSVTGISHGTARNWLDGKTRPSGEHFATLCMVFGPAFLVASLHNPPAWILEALTREKQRNIEAEIERLTAAHNSLSDMENADVQNTPKGAQEA